MLADLMLVGACFTAAVRCVFAAGFLALTIG